MIAVNAARYSLVVPEKYDVERCSHDVFCEYGNVGTDFEYITKEGFGWTNASFQVGLEGLQAHSLKLLEETVWRLGVETADETP